MSIKHLFLIVATLSIALGCQPPQSDEKYSKIEKQNTIKPMVSQKKLTLNEAKKLAETQFKKYLPTILDAHDAYVDSQDTFTGDFTGDGLADIAIYFSLAPKEGGNAIVGQGLTLYKNMGTTVKVLAGYEPDYYFNVVKIADGKIHVQKLAYAETDGRCCPSIKTEHTLTIAGGKAY
ncbi:MAG: hypothetical protein EOO47_26170 [Flavobacterium sp.]|nr:MAG: hypothetical protein EOO47_26170 [Flavobacterium sp.]